MATHTGTCRGGLLLEMSVEQRRTTNGRPRTARNLARNLGSTNATALAARPTQAILASSETSSHMLTIAAALRRAAGGLPRRVQSLQTCQRDSRRLSTLAGSSAKPCTPKDRSNGTRSTHDGVVCCKTIESWLPRTPPGGSTRRACSTLCVRTNACKKSGSASVWRHECCPWV